MEEPPRGMKAQARECGNPGSLVKKKNRETKKVEKKNGSHWRAGWP